MDKYYTAIMIISVFALVIMEVCAHISSNLTHEKKRQFTFLFVVTAVAFICEYSGTALQGAPGCLRLLHIVVKAAELSIAPVIGLVMAGILKRSEHKKILLTVLGIHAILECLSGRFGFIYMVTEDNIYVHAEYYWIYVAVYLLSAVYALCVIFAKMKSYQYNGAAFLALLAVFVVLGITIQLCDSSVKIVWPMMTITDILLYVFNAEMIQQTDALTRLINRRGYEVFLSHIQTPAVILFFDVDKFKHINDTYGHIYGVACLRTVGDLLRSVYARFGKCFRIGGDEFCVILMKKTDQIESFNNGLLGKVDECRKADSRFPSVSIGYARFHPDTDNMADVIKEADRAMYHYKQMHRTITENNQ